MEEHDGTSYGEKSSLKKQDTTKIPEKELRRRKAREGMKRYREAMTTEKKDRLRKENRERMKRYRASMNEQQKQNCKERMRKWRASLTEERRKVMRKKDRERKKKLRDAKLKKEWPQSKKFLKGSHTTKFPSKIDEESSWDERWNDSEIII